MDSPVCDGGRAKGQGAGQAGSELKTKHITRTRAYPLLRYHGESS